MDTTDVLTMTIDVTDMGAAFASYAAITDRLDAAGATPPGADPVRGPQGERPYDPRMPVPEPAAAVVAAFWAPYASSIGATGGPADVYCFSDSAAMADELAALVLGGRKRATAGVARQLDEAGLTVSVGDDAVIHDGRGVPVCVVRTTDVRRGPMSSVDEQFAWDEGEGDRSRSDWLRGHRAYVGRVFAAAGWAPAADPELVFERFTVVWPPAVADPVA